MDDKEKLTTLLALSKQSWDNFYERRKFETRASAGIYTLYGLSIAGIWQYLDKEAVKSNWFFCSALIIGLLLLLAHLRWLWGASRANFIDKRKAIFYEDKLQELIQCPFTQDVNSLFVDSPLSKSYIPKFYQDWSLLVQILVSLIMYGALLAIVKCA